MLSLEILRTHSGLSIQKLLEESGIAKQTYYNVLAGNPITDQTFLKLSKTLNAPFLKSLLPLDHLYLTGSKIQSIQFPKYIPEDIRQLFLEHHPVFK